MWLNSVFIIAGLKEGSNSYLPLLVLIFVSFFSSSTVDWI